MTASQRPGADRNALIEAAVAVMVREGGRLAEWHGWRCEHPDRYGECDCNREVAAEIVTKLLPLIADAIEAEKASNEFRNVVIDRCANLVRTLGHDEPETGE